MSISMYDASVPVFTRALRNLDQVLAKGEAHARDRGVEPDVLLQTRLIFDMLPLVRQVQIAADMATRGTARLAGVEPAKFEDSETTFEQLHSRIARAIEYIEGFRPEQFVGSETRPVSFMSRRGEMKFEGQGYLLTFVLPNLFFHITTAYNLLRQSGVTIGKADYLGES
ncbi:MAG TPA: DUF1993 domain-containing protein [Lysobacter sp.]|jgi:hypothetical protein|nr:DUF1993 domain-containing protein [Lysobacter sp.]